MHFRLLRARSPYFQQLLLNWSDNLEEPTHLPDTNPEDFDQFLSWLYTDHIDLRGTNGDWLSLCRVWVMAEKYQVQMVTRLPEIPTTDHRNQASALQNCVVEAFSSFLCYNNLATLNLKVLKYVYDKTESQSLFRKLFIHICIWYGNVDGFAELTGEMPPDFHTDYALQRAMKMPESSSCGLSVYAKDLTRFLVQERDTGIAEKRAKYDREAQLEAKTKQRRDSVIADKNRRTQ